MEDKRPNEWEIANRTLDAFPVIEVAKKTILRMSDGERAEYTSSDLEILTIEGETAYGKRLVVQ